MEIEHDKVYDVDYSEINSKYLKKKIKIKGMISRTSGILSEKLKTIYRCTNCGKERTVNGTKKPYYCYNCQRECNFDKDEEIFRDFREIEVEEIIDEYKRQPIRINVLLLDEILDRLDIREMNIGETVEIIGVVDKRKVKIKNDREIYSYYITCAIIKKLENDNIEEITEEDRKKIDDIRNNNPLQKLSEELAPNIIGFESIKKALILQMVRGPNNLENVRPRIHILIIGDPSVAKSKLVWEVYNKTSNSIYGSADNISKAGLGITAERDELSGQWTARGGLLCRANNSTIVLDELDKIRDSDIAALHTPMESGEAIMNKVVTAKMKADFSLLACCNPKNGSFDTSGYNSVEQETKLPSAIVSRFNLIYYVRDKVDKENDRKIIRAMMKNKEEREFDVLLLKKYIYLAKKIEPILTEDVKEVVEETYLKFRDLSKNGTEKIDPRDGGSLLALATASAKIRMSEIIELEDLKIAEELTLDSFQSLGFERNFNSIDKSSIYSSVTKKRINVQNQLIELIKELLLSGKSSEKEIEESILSKGFAVDLFKRTLNGLRNEGSIIGNHKNLQWIN